MTTFLHHRFNSLTQSSSVSKGRGAEIDLRISFGEVVLAHDPFREGCSFKDWLRLFEGNLLILNIKEMGLEDYLVNIIDELKPELKYFFLDLTTPYLISSVGKGIACAARVSEYESVDSAIKQGTSWLWVDSFSGNWDHLNQLNEYPEVFTKKLCLVSPELQGRELKSSPEFFHLLNKLNDQEYKFNAICSKYPELWESVIL